METDYPEKIFNSKWRRYQGVLCVYQFLQQLLVFRSLKIKCLLYLNLVYKYKRQIILSLLRRCLKLCSSAFEASSGHGLADTWKRKLDTIVSSRIRYVETPKKIIRLELYRIRGNVV